MSEPKLTYHEVDDKMIIHYSQDIEKHLAAAKAARRNDAEYRTAFGKRAEFRHVMHVPRNVWLIIAAKLNIPFGEVLWPEHQPRIMAELKSPEYRELRVVNDVRI